MINKEKKKKQKINLNLLIMLIAFITLVMFLLPCVSSIAKAENNKYTTVIQDLFVDSSFKIEDYPTINGDYSLQVIQVAESNEKELFVYVYQPSSYITDLRATSINISQGINENVKYVNYTLEYLSSFETIYKYKVNDLVVKNDALRYYDITSIFRKWSSVLDDETGNDNEIDEVAYDVSKLFTASTVKGEVSYSCLESETIEITNKYVDHIRYLNGFWLYTDSCDSHYVAFSTNKQIDKLMEADLTYIAEIGSGSLATGRWTVDKTEKITKTIYADEEVSSDMTGPFGHTYTWNRIESVSEFIEKEDLKDETKKNLENMQWVLRFAETDYTEYNGMFNPHYEATKVSEVTILRLKFETNGLVYNLGVIDNKQSGDDIPGNNENSWFDNLIKWLIRIALIVLAVVLVILLFPYIVDLIVYIFKGIWWLITLPFKAFKKKDK